MAGSKEIRTKIKSVENTRKITKAMEMVAASKMRKAKDRMLAKRPYTETILQIIHNIAAATKLIKWEHALYFKFVCESRIVYRLYIPSQHNQSLTYTLVLEVFDGEEKLVQPDSGYILCISR